MWFIPNSTLTAEQSRKMPTEVAVRTPIALLNVAKSLHPMTEFDIVPIEKLCRSREARENAQRLEKVFKTHGSDKSTLHNYHLLYGYILCRLPAELKILEIGLGSNDTEMPSNMGATGIPGASLRSFKEALPSACVYGADIDPKISVDGFTTFIVDQTNLDSFGIVSESIGCDFDLIIDDGLHSPDANLNTLAFALKHLSPRGFIVIEDIPEAALSIWKSLSYLILNSGFNTLIVSSKSAYVFICTPRSLTV
jgi:hypothetical protein